MINALATFLLLVILSSLFSLLNTGRIAIAPHLRDECLHDVNGSCWSTGFGSKHFAAFVNDEDAARRVLGGFLEADR